MAALTTAQRNRMPSRSFAIPGKRAYPIENKAHAQNAMARVAQHGTPSEKSRVAAAVHQRFPSMGKSRGGFAGHMGGMHMASMKHGARMSFGHRMRMMAEGGEIGSGSGYASEQGELDHELNDIDMAAQEGADKIDQHECPACGHEFACGGMAMKADGGDIQPSDAEDMPERPDFFSRPRPGEKKMHPLSMMLMKHGMTR